jgi:hypothetical protein
MAKPLQKPVHAANLHQLELRSVQREWGPDAAWTCQNHFRTEAGPENRAVFITSVTVNNDYDGQIV